MTAGQAFGEVLGGQRGRRGARVVGRQNPGLLGRHQRSGGARRLLGAAGDPQAAGGDVAALPRGEVRRVGAGPHEQQGAPAAVDADGFSGQREAVRQGHRGPRVVAHHVGLGADPHQALPAYRVGDGDRGRQRHPVPGRDELRRDAGHHHQAQYRFVGGQQVDAADRGAGPADRGHQLGVQHAGGVAGAGAVRLTRRVHRSALADQRIRADARRNARRDVRGDVPGNVRAETRAEAQAQPPTCGIRRRPTWWTARPRTHDGAPRPYPEPTPAPRRPHPEWPAAPAALSDR